MTNIFQELQALVGKDIEFLKGLEAYVEELDAGMRATVLRISDEMNDSPTDPCFTIHYTFAKFDAFNQGVEIPAYYDKDGERL